MKKHTLTIRQPLNQGPINRGGSCVVRASAIRKLLPHQSHMKRQPSRKYARATGVCVRSCAFKGESMTVSTQLC